MAGELRDINIHPDNVLLKCDVKDFYLNGSCDDLSNWASSIVPDMKLRSAVKIALEVLLTYQLFPMC